MHPDTEMCIRDSPAPGETVGDASFMQALGGKGANQAVAAARLGGSVTFITSLGNDMYAEILKKHFKKEGITTDYIIDDVNQPTGTALIFVADSGENCIAVAPGANYSLLPGSIIHFSKVIDEADIIVCLLYTSPAKQPIIKGIKIRSTDTQKEGWIFFLQPS